MCVDVVFVYGIVDHFLHSGVDISLIVFHFVVSVYIFQFFSV